MENITIIKVGGAVVEDKARLASLLDSFHNIQGRKILVHGGGRSATKLATRLGIESKMIGGRRITDSEMLNVVTMVYGGLVNKNIVAALQANGDNAIGLTGADMNIILAHKREPKDGIDYGYVGDVDHVDSMRLHDIIESGTIPVIAPLTHDGKGNILNTNADTIAAETAKSLASLYNVTLVYAFEKRGVLADPDYQDSVIRQINKDDFERYKSSGTIAGGMLPKLENAFAAIEAGVKKVAITKDTDLTVSMGTIIE